MDQLSRVVETWPTRHQTIFQAFSSCANSRYAFLEQFSNLKEKMIAATGYTGKKVKEVSQATSRELDKAIARWTPLPLSPEEIDRLTNLRESYNS